MKKTLPLLLVLTVSLFACTLFDRQPVSGGETPTLAAVSATLRHGSGSTQKICQLTGDLDRQTGQPTGMLMKTDMMLESAP